MGNISGSLRGMSIKGREFSATADADLARKLGGVENEVQPNGDLTARIVQTVVPWRVGGITVGIRDDRGDQEFLQEIADSGEEVHITFTFRSNIAYQANGTIVGEIAFNSMAGTAGIECAGGGTATKQ